MFHGEWEVRWAKNKNSVSKIEIITENFFHEGYPLFVDTPVVHLDIKLNFCDDLVDVRTIRLSDWVLSSSKYVI